MVTLTWFAGEFHLINYDTVEMAKEAAQVAADRLAPLVDEQPVKLQWDGHQIRLDWLELTISHGCAADMPSNLTGQDLLNELNIG